MSNINADLQYTKTHEWVQNNGDGTYNFGITDHAQSLLGDIVFVELANEGDEFANEDEICVVESVKAASGIYAPSDIEVIAINTTLTDTPEIINDDCYGDGWLIKFKSNNLTNLLDAQQYQQLLESEQ